MSEKSDDESSYALVLAVVICPLMLFVLLIVFVDEAIAWLAKASARLAELTSWLEKVNRQIDAFSMWYYPTLMQILLALLAIVALGLFVSTVYGWITNRGKN